MSCNDGYFLEGTSCVSVCPAGKYGMVSTNTCESCSSECLTCTGKLFTQC